MAVSHGRAATIFASGFNLSTYLNSVTLTGIADSAETSTFGTTSKSYIPGLLDGTLSLAGFYDGATNADIDIINAALGNTTNAVVTHFPQGDTFGNDGWGFAAFATSLAIDTNLGGAAAISSDLQSSVGAEILTSLHALGAETTATNSASVDNSASSATGGVAYLHVTAFSGTDLTIKVQHSTNDSTWVDLLTFTQVTAANAKERVRTAALTTTVNRYTRTIWATSGGFTSCTFVVGFGRNPRA